MSPIRRGPDPTRADVEAFLDEVQPGKGADQRLHTLICWVYHRALFLDSKVFSDLKSQIFSGGDLISVRRRAFHDKLTRRGVGPEKVEQVLAGDFTGVTWKVLESVLVACDAKQADLETAEPLFGTLARSHGRHDDPQGVPPEPRGNPPDPRQRPTLAPREEAAHPPAPAPPTTQAPPKADSGTPARAPAPTDHAEEDEANRTTGRSADASSTGTRQPPTAPAEPDPTTATTAAEFVELMKAYRVFAGGPTLRKMAAAGINHPLVNRSYSYSSFSTIGKNGRLPRLELVRAYIAGTGAPKKTVELWDSAHRHLSLRLTRSEPPGH